MRDVINILPDNVANQIAAGEVIQRPASVVKELIENSIDAGAGSISVSVVDAGKTKIQVIDNGKGMSPSDARLCWERHSTSKIRDASDLFTIQTKGFRGEALASIAAISEVVLKTRPEEEEVGTQVLIAGSEIKSNEPVACPRGSNFSIKNLFYNVPARRKFLKSNPTELRHIINEIHHVAMAHPGVECSLHHNDSRVFNLPATNLKKRIVNIIGKHAAQSLIPVDSETSMISINGFIGKPEYARKTYGEQFFFANGRYIRHPYFHKAIMQAFENIIPADTIPSYFIYFTIEPEHIDVNIHPTKTEVKFENEQALWQILHAVIKESIGKHNLSPSIDFDSEGIIEIPTLRKDTEITPPRINLQEGFNPFTEDNFSRQGQSGRPENTRSQDWEKLFRRETKHEITGTEWPEENREDALPEVSRLLQLKRKYVLSPVKSGLMIIDQKRAHERIIFEKLISNSNRDRVACQKLLFPENIELNASDFVIFTEINDKLSELGFDIGEFGKQSIIVNGIPETAKNSDVTSLIEEILEEYKTQGRSSGGGIKEKLAISLAKASSIRSGKVLEQEEMRELVDQLFACSNPNHSPTGKPVISIIRTEEIEKSLKG